MLIDELDKELAQKNMKNQCINKSQLAKKYGVDRHTISRHLKNVKGNKTERKRRRCEILNYETEISECLKNGDSIKSIYMYLLNGTTRDKLKSYSNFKHYVAKWFKDDRVEGKKNIVRFRFETPPGDQLQFDWITPLSIHLENGELVNFNLWSATLGFSRYHYFEVTESITEDDFKHCLVDTLIYLGGSPNRLLTDNMSAIVTIRGNQKTIHPTVSQFLKDLNLKLGLCKTRHAYTKGKVEVSNKYQNWLAPYDFKFKTKSSLFKGIQQILNQSNYQENSETNVPPVILFKKEKGTLRKLPSLDMLKSYTNQFYERKVNISSLIDYRGAKYGVPYKYINKNVLVKEIKNFIYIYDVNLNSIGLYEIKQSGIYYDRGLYDIARRNNETFEEFNARIEKNLNQLARIKELKNESIY